MEIVSRTWSFVHMLFSNFFCTRIQNVMRLSPDGEPDPNVVRSLAKCNHLERQIEPDKFAMEPIQGLQTAHFAFMEIWNYFMDIHSMTKQQALIASFLHMSHGTILLPELYKLRCLLIGPPASGKTTVNNSAARALPKELVMVEDGTTPAVQRRNAGYDCMLFIKDEEKRMPDMNDIVQEQTAASSGYLQTMVSEQDEVTKRWKTVQQTQVRRVCVCATTNGYQETHTEAGETRRLTLQLGRADLQANLTMNAVIENTNEYDEYMRELNLKVMVKPALIDTFLMPGKWVTYNMTIFNLLLKHHGFKITQKRQTDMMLCFAISMQLKLFYMHIERLKILKTITEEDYWKSYCMNRYASFEGIIIAHNLYTQLTGLEEEKERLVSHLGMLIKVTADEGQITTGEVTTNGAYYQTTVSLTTHANESRMLAKLVKRLEYIGEKTKWVPGDAFIRKQIQNLGIEQTSSVKRDPVKIEDGTWYILKKLVDSTPSEGENIFLAAIREHCAKKERVKLHPYDNGDANAQSEKQVIITLNEIKELFMGENPPETSGQNVRAMHELEKLIPGTLVQVIGLLKQRHNDNRTLIMKIISGGSIYPAEYMTKEEVSFFIGNNVLCCTHAPFFRLMNCQTMHQEDH